MIENPLQNLPGSRLPALRQELDLLDALWKTRKFSGFGAALGMVIWRIFALVGIVRQIQIASVLRLSGTGFTKPSQKRRRPQNASLAI